MTNSLCMFLGPMSQLIKCQLLLIAKQLNVKIDSTFLLTVEARDQDLASVVDEITLILEAGDVIPQCLYVMFDICSSHNAELFCGVISSVNVRFPHISLNAVGLVHPEGISGLSTMFGLLAIHAAITSNCRFILREFGNEQIRLLNAKTSDDQSFTIGEYANCIACDLFPLIYLTKCVLAIHRKHCILDVRSTVWRWIKRFGIGSKSQVEYNTLRSLASNINALHLSKVVNTAFNTTNTVVQLSLATLKSGDISSEKKPSPSQSARPQSNQTVLNSSELDKMFAWACTGVSWVWQAEYNVCNQSDVSTTAALSSSATLQSSTNRSSLASDEVVYIVFESCYTRQAVQSIAERARALVQCFAFNNWTATYHSRQEIMDAYSAVTRYVEDR